MCAIAGIFDLEGQREIDASALERMTASLAHRGPDSDGFYYAPGIGMGHRRLVIIDEEGGKQPFITQNPDGVLSFNGEIYNFRELAGQLKQRGGAIHTNSDTEVLAKGLAYDGSAFLSKTRGMFAFSYWRPADRTLILGRDRLGEKPLYYAQTDDGFLIFASEIQALIASRMIKADLNNYALADYFFYGFVPDPKSIYRNVFKLPAGHILKAQTGKNLNLARYWRPSFNDQSGLTFSGAAEALSEKIDETAGLQMYADRPLGAFLSGGIDSGGIVAAMAKNSANPIACTVGFHEAAHDELPAAKDVAARFGAAHHTAYANAVIPELIEKIAAIFGEPFADSSAIPAFIAAQLARQHVSVALNGDGADEVFAGYRRYPFFLREEVMRKLAPEPLRRMVFAPASSLYPKLDWAPRPFRLKSTLQSLSQSRAEGYASALAINLPMRMQKMLTPEFKDALRDYHPQQVVVDAMADAGECNELARLQYTDFMTWLPGRMLTKIDRVSMANSLETRSPYLDHTLVEWANKLPLNYKVRHGVTKRILRRALAPRLGEAYVNKPKQGFGLPLQAWLRQPSNNPLELLDSSDIWRNSSVIDERAIQNMRRRHIAGVSDCSQELWTVIMFDAFLRSVYAQ